MAHIKVIMIGTRDNLQKIYDSVGDSSAETSAELAFGYDYLDDNVDFYSFRESRAFNSVELKWTKKDAEYKHLLDEIKDPIRCPDIIDIRCAPPNGYNPSDFIDEDRKRVIEDVTEILYKSRKQTCDLIKNFYPKFNIPK